MLERRYPAWVEYYAFRRHGLVNDNPSGKDGIHLYKYWSGTLWRKPKHNRHFAIIFDLTQ